MPKPVVKYKLPIPSIINVGECQVIEPIDHPSPFVSNTKPIITSPVVTVGQHGMFATQNTIYVPCYEEVYV